MSSICKLSISCVECLILALPGRGSGSEDAAGHGG